MAIIDSFRLARPEDADQILAAYQNAQKDPFCTWNDSYPTHLGITRDLATNNLYVITHGGRIAGAISVVPENELDGFDCWSVKNAKEIARVVVTQPYQRQGLAYQMVQKIASMLGTAIHLSVVKTNLPAYHTYLKAGFTVVADAQMYGNDYYLMEKI